ncbi:MAG: AarF/UbiB family protein [Acidimicrobiales bacterium]
MDLWCDVVDVPGLDPEPVVDEIRSRLIEELDYELEAKSQQFYADYFDGHPYITVPHIIPELSGPTVLTSQLATGARFGEVTSWSQEERNLTAETLFRFSFGSIYRVAMFNGDFIRATTCFAPAARSRFSISGW